ncbi:MAG: hypothetical protein K2X38_12285 [Gemmataceae bacterium]|nr:hypothetical protein [Gemmataceae bacterium]
MRDCRTYASLLALLVGCEPAAPSVSGRVTLDGKPLEAGFVTLYPEGTGATQGAEIRSGEFRIEKVAAGPAKLVVTTPPIAAQQVKKGTVTTLKFETPIQSVTASMQGNGVPVRIQSGHQSIDIALRNAPSKKPR